MDTAYETDVVAWAEEQVALLKAGRLSQIDADNIAEEIAAVSSSEKRELRHRCAVLLLQEPAGVMFCLGCFSRHVRDLGEWKASETRAHFRLRWSVL